jgi:hypothetical protein
MFVVVTLEDLDLLDNFRCYLVEIHLDMSALMSM